MIDFALVDKKKSFRSLGNRPDVYVIDISI